MIDIVNALGYPIDKGVIAHLTRSKAVLSTLSGYKKLSTSDTQNMPETKERHLGQVPPPSKTCFFARVPFSRLRGEHSGGTISKSPFGGQKLLVLPQLEG